MEISYSLKCFNKYREALDILSVIYINNYISNFRKYKLSSAEGLNKIAGES